MHPRFSIISHGTGLLPEWHFCFDQQQGETYRFPRQLLHAVSVGVTGGGDTDVMFVGGIADEASVTARTVAMDRLQKVQKIFRGQWWGKEDGLAGWLHGPASHKEVGTGRDGYGPCKWIPGKT